MRARAAVLIALSSIAGAGAACRGAERAERAERTGAERTAEPIREGPMVRAPQITEIEGVDAAELPPEVRQDFWRVINETFCYCDCPKTIAACLANKAQCPCVRCSERMTRFILDQYRARNSTEEVELQLLEGFAEGYNGAPRSFDLANRPTLGPDKAKHTIVEFADFRCGHCKEAAQVLHELVATNPDVKLVYYYFPLGGPDSPSILVAEAAEEARAQGKFWEMHDVLFKNQHALDEESLAGYAGEVGLDVERFKTALAKRTHRERVLADRREGERANVQATPTVFIDGRPFGLARTLENFRLRVELEGERGRCD